MVRVARVEKQVIVARNNSGGTWGDWLPRALSIARENVTPNCSVNVCHPPMFFSKPLEVDKNF